MNTLVGVLFGWLLGILGQRPIIYVQQSLKKTTFKKAVIAELQELRCRLGMSAYLILCRIGDIDKNFIQWVYPIIKSYKGFYAELGIADKIAKILQANDIEFEALKRIMKSEADFRQGLTIRKFSTTFIDSIYGDIHMFDLVFQKDILEIREQLRYINDEIDNSLYYFRKTFDSGLSEGNAKIVKKNLESSYGNIARMSVNLTNNIGAAIERAT